MRRALLILGALLITAGSVAAEDEWLNVMPAGEDLLETEPRMAVTGAFLVTNKSKKSREFITSVILPEGWKLLFKDFPFELEPGETDVRLLSLLIPQGTPAGTYKVIYTVKRKDIIIVRESSTVFIRVLPVRKLRVELLASPEFVIAGEEYNASFVVINESNIEAPVAVSAESNKNLPFTLDTDQLLLSPGESRAVSVTVKTDAELKKKFDHFLHLTVQFLDYRNVKAEAKSVVEIVPSVTGVKELWHKIPSEIRFKQSIQHIEETGYGFAAEISGEGTLDEKGGGNISFLFSKPYDPGISGLPYHEEYRLSLWTERYGLHMGDRSYVLSPLTESSRYGRGIEGNLNIGNFSVGSYYMKTMWSTTETQEAAARLDYSFYGENSIGINYLKKYRYGEADIASAEGHFEPFSDLSIDLEYALGAEDKTGDAYLIKAGGDYSRINYFFQFIHADPEYPGYYRDVNYLSANCTFPIGNALTGNAGFRRTKHNLNMDPALYSASLENYYQLGLNYTFKTGTGISLDWRMRDHKDRFPDPAYNYCENTLKLGAKHPFKKLSLDAYLEPGIRTNKLNNQTSYRIRYTASAVFQPTDQQTYGGSIWHHIEGLPENKRSYFYTDISAYFQLLEKTSLETHFKTYHHQQYINLNRYSFEVRGEHTFSNMSKLSAHGVYTLYINSQGDGEGLLTVEYGMPLGIPVSRKKNVGMAEGYVYDVETKKPVADVILRIGSATAVTGEDGGFSFPSLQTGENYLHVNTVRAGPGLITDQKTPVKLTVKAAKKTRVEIGLTRPAVLIGQIMVYRFKKEDMDIISKDNLNPGDSERDISWKNKEDELTADYGLANTIVELSGVTEVKRVLTDKNGRFEFPEIIPGRWTLKVSDDNLPEYHYLEQDTFEFDFIPGEREEIFIKVIPRRRRIQIIEEGAVLEEEVIE